MRRALISALAVMAVLGTVLGPAPAVAIEAGDGGASVTTGGAGTPQRVQRRQKPAETLGLAVNKSRVLRFDAPVKDVLVSQSEIVDVAVRSRRQAYMVARNVGSTNVFFLGTDGNVLRHFEITVSVDVAPLRRLISKVYPDADVRVSAQGTSIFLDGTVHKAERVDSLVKMAGRFKGENGKVVNLLSVEKSQQVLLKMRVAEVKRSALKQLGFGTQVNNQTLFSTASEGFGLSTGGAGSAFIPNNPSFLQSGNMGYRNTELFGGDTPLRATFQALEKQDLVRTLAEPNLVAVSGEEAKLFSGGRIPFVTTIIGDNGTRTERPRWDRVGVSLGFTPVVLSPERLSLRLSAEVSQQDPQNNAVSARGNTYPAFQNRRTNTTVQLPSGGTLMIAGLIRNDITENVEGVPGLKNLPILGQLFSSRAFQRDQSELVIMVTAYVVEAGSDAEMALPTDGYAPPTDADLFLLGRLQHLYADDSTPLSGEEGVAGPVGFMMR